MKVRKPVQPDYFGHHEKTKTSGLLKAVVSLFVILPIAIILYRPLLRGYEKWLIAASQDPTAEIAVVLDDNLPRIESAVELFKDGKVKHIYIDTPLQSTVQQIAATHAVPLSFLHWSGCGATTTYEQAIFFAAAREASSFPFHKSIVIVTSPHHLRRASWSFEHVLDKDKVDIIVKSHAAEDEKLRERLDWWQYPYAREWISFETQKNIFYRFRYGLLGKEHVDVPYHSFLDKEGTTGNVDIKSKCQ